MKIPDLTARDFFFSFVTRSFHSLVGSQGSLRSPWATGTAIVHDTGRAAEIRLKKNEKNFNSETTKKYIFADWLN